MSRASALRTTSSPPGIDGLVVAAATDAHAPLILAGVDAGIPTFCEKPVAADVDGTLAVLDKLAGSDVQVQIGFQRRFDKGYVAARAAVASGELGWIHTMRSGHARPAPPPADYIGHSGGIFRDCSVHDFDSVRWVSGHEVREVYAVGANRGAAFFAEHGDVDTAAVVLTLDDGTFALVSATRYNARGYDVRLEVLGSKDSVSVGLDDRLPLRSVEPGVAFPGGAPYPAFMERFHDAYVAELTAFTRIVAGRRAGELHGRRRAGGLLRRRGLRALARRAPAGLARRGPPVTGLLDAGRRCPDLLGRLRGARLGPPARGRAGADRDA